MPEIATLHEKIASVHTVNMPLTTKTRDAIHNYLIGELTRYIEENAATRRAVDGKPFHTRLLPALFNIRLSERSFSTRSGSWWQRISRLIGQQYHLQAELQYRIKGRIKPAASQHIDEIIRQLNIAGRRTPNRKNDIREVCTVQSAGGDTLDVCADLYILTHAHKEMYFEIKTPQPNKDTSMAMKKFILRVAALRDGEPAEAYGATAYNPYGDGSPYTWNYANQFLEIGEDLLIGRAFWGKIGDDSTYDELLEISETVGKQIAQQMVVKD
ncbi:MAG: TdeIII family type II restriction endonuclease [Acidobacteriaceae bacterium]